MTTLTDEGMDLIFRKARSYNGYQDRPVSEEQLRAVWDLAQWGPTSANMLPARIVWCVSDEAKQRLAACATGTNSEKILKAPVTAIIGMDMAFYDQLHRTFPHTDARSWFMDGKGEPNTASVEDAAFRNSSLQGAYLIIAARALGLDTGPMSGIDKDAVDAAFFAETRFRTNFITTMGYGDPATIFDRLPRLDFEDVNRIA